MLELNKLYNMDCLEGLKLLDDGCIDLTVTSPPYDNLRDYNGFSFDFEGIAQELYRVTKDGGVVVWIVNDATVNGSETGTSFKQALFFKECGFNLHDTMVWEKSSCAFPEATRYQPMFEYMFVLSKGKPKTINLINDKKNKWGGMAVHGTFREADGSLKQRSSTWKEVKCKEYGCRSNVWQITEEKNNKTSHPAVFPIRLVKDHIISWSNKKDIVLDVFMGSGTTAIACIDMNRRYIGFEISKEYYEKACERIEEKQAQLRFDI